MNPVRSQTPKASAGSAESNRTSNGAKKPPVKWTLNWRPELETELKNFIDKIYGADRVGLYGQYHSDTKTCSV